jgi:hypothetical protein
MRRRRFYVRWRSASSGEGETLSMDVYWFDVEVAGPVTEDQGEALGGLLAARGGIDATAAKVRGPGRAPVPFAAAGAVASCAPA